jgi:hypothetical protein
VWTDCNSSVVDVCPSIDRSWVYKRGKFCGG